jgi:hypothetical protein
VFIVREYLSLPNHKQVLSRTFGDVSVDVEKQCLVKAATDSFTNSENRVYVLATRLRGCGHHV